MNSCNTDIFFSNYYHLQSVRFEFEYIQFSFLKRPTKILLYNSNIINRGEWLLHSSIFKGTEKGANIDVK